MVLAQQAIGSSAAVHFTSPRLRREATEEAGDLINDFQSLMTSLVLAKRSEALALAKQLQDAQNRVKESEMKEDKAQQATKVAEEKLAQKDAELVASNAYTQQLEAQLQALKNSEYNIL